MKIGIYVFSPLPNYIPKYQVFIWINIGYRESPLNVGCSESPHNDDETCMCVCVCVCVCVRWCLQRYVDKSIIAHSR